MYRQLLHAVTSKGSSFHFQNLTTEFAYWPYCYLERRNVSKYRHL